jgi:hypothetical protein
MQFRAMNPLEERFPVSSVGDTHQQFDLHNDGDLREIAFHWRQKSLRATCTLKKPAWQDPVQAETEKRQTVASVALVFSGVRDLSVEGPLVSSTERGDSGLDFLEYHREAGGIGKVRIVLLNGSAIVVRASACELQTTSEL